MENTHFQALWFWGKKKKADNDNNNTESQGGTISIDQNIIVMMQHKQERTQTREKWQVLEIFSKSY